MTRKDIPGFEGRYAADDEGHIYSYRLGRNLREQNQWAGYRTKLKRPMWSLRPTATTVTEWRLVAVPMRSL